MVNSDKLTGTTEHLTLQARCLIYRCRYNRVRLYLDSIVFTFSDTSFWQEVFFYVFRFSVLAHSGLLEAPSLILIGWNGTGVFPDQLSDCQLHNQYTIPRKQVSLKKYIQKENKNVSTVKTYVKDSLTFIFLSQFCHFGDGCRKAN